MELFQNNSRDMFLEKVKIVPTMLGKFKYIVLLEKSRQYLLFRKVKIVPTSKESLNILYC